MITTSHGNSLKFRGWRVTAPWTMEGVSVGVSMHTDCLSFLNIITRYSLFNNPLILYFTMRITDDCTVVMLIKPWKERKKWNKRIKRKSRFALLRGGSDTICPEQHYVSNRKQDHHTHITHIQGGVKNHTHHTTPNQTRGRM